MAKNRSVNCKKTPDDDKKCRAKKHLEKITVFEDRQQILIIEIAGVLGRAD